MLIVYKKPTRGRFFVVGKPGSGPVPVPQPDDELWYTTSDGTPVDISGASFNANVVSHAYTGGKGVIKFDANLTEIGANSFENADIVTVSFPDTLTTIGDSAFDSCPITELDLKNVQSLGMEAFDYNYVSALHIPASVNYMNYNPFRTPYGNQTITVDENNTTFSDGGGCNCVYNETSHTLVVGGPNSTVPTGCTTIGEFAFSNCYNLTSIEFPASVTSIEWLAFGSDEQGNLATIRAHSVPTFGSNAFMSVADNGTLYLDAGLDPTDWMNELPAGWSLVQPCSVSISAGANGLISVDGGTPTSSYSGTVNYGTQITIQAIPDTDYEFDSWSDGDSTNPRTLTVDSDVSLTATFQAQVQYYSVSVSAGSNGSVSVNGVSGDYSDSVASGTTLTLVATANNGYQFSQWSDGDTNATRTITVTGNVTLTASFQVSVDQFKVTNTGSNPSKVVMGIIAETNNTSQRHTFNVTNMSLVSESHELNLEWSTDKTNWTSVAYTYQNFNFANGNFGGSVYVGPELQPGESLYLRNFDAEKLYVEYKNTSNIYYYAFPGIGMWDTTSRAYSQFSVSGELSTMFKDQSARNRIRMYMELGDCSQLKLDKVYDTWHNSSDTRYDSTHYGTFASMFYGCSAITNPPQITYSQQTTKYGQYYYMFRYCTSLTSAPVFPETTITKKALLYTFSNCSALASVEVKFTNWSTYKISSGSSSFNTNNWLSSVASVGTFKKPSALSTTRDTSHIPANWTVVDV